MFIAFAINIQAQEIDSAKEQNITEVIINHTKKYKNDQAFAVSKLPLKDIQNPQVYNSIPKAIIKDQVSTNLNQVLKNATGITRLWESTSRGGDGAEYYTMRGFSVQPNLVNGMASFNNGGLDPANIENIDVIKGPSGTLYGSTLTSYGGLINIQTKKPYEKFGGEISYINGSYGLNRVTVDVNTPVSQGLYMRINSAYHIENSFQDAGFNKVFFVAPSLKYIASDKLTFLVNTEFKTNETANAPMVFLSRYAKLSFDNIGVFENNYEKSYTSNNLTVSNPSFGIQAQMIYKFSDKWTSQTVFSRSNTKAVGYYQYLWDSSNGDVFTRFISKSNSQTNALGIQQNFIGNYNIGSLRNKIVIGLDYLTTDIVNNDTQWKSHGSISFVNQKDTAILTTQAVDVTLVSAKVNNINVNQKIKSAYVSNVINFLPNLSAMLSIRADNFSGKPTQWSSSEVGNQTTFSPKFGIVYQPILDKISVFANYMNGFKYLSPGTYTNTDGSKTEQFYNPEKANQWETGIKANFFQGKISLVASYYDIKVADKLMPDTVNPLNSVQGGEVTSKGFEISVVGSPIEGLNIISGFSNNKSEVTKGEASYLGLRPEEAGPEKLFNLWLNYKFPYGEFKNFGFGFGANYGSEHKTLNRSTVGTFTLPSYVVLNSMIGYFGERYNVTLKLDNLGNVKYFSGWSTVMPQRPRALSLSLGFKF